MVNYAKAYLVLVWMLVPQSKPWFQQPLEGWTGSGCTQVALCMDEQAPSSATVARAKAIFIGFGFLLLMTFTPLAPLRGGHRRLAKLAQELPMTFVKKPQVGHTILQHCQAFNPRPKGKAGCFFRV